MAAPPLLEGALKLITALALPAVALTPVGAPGADTGAIGVTLGDEAENAPVPAVLTAATEKV